ncbi:hypothetical protein FGO68_gene10522 [Halteria grandinella]|uniref:Band 7 domain-containing protein n=1 Tax=Halteria grandinella TaxID=5974 RepID=A0A8J8NKW2_HALGN|nr:hypothetical protein FGO68_gene10522 [Halteria grandinella]
MASKEGAACCSILLLLCVIILSTVLMGVSVKDVSFWNAAIKINSITKKIETGVVYMPGKYYVSPSEKFVDYSTKWQWITFATGGDSGIISAKTSNPSNIYLEVSIMYRIREENLHDIYKKWPTKSIQRDFILFAKDAIQKVPENYTNNDFFTNREQIAQVMSERVNTVFRNNYGELILFLITDVQLDSSFETSLENQQASKRDAETAIQQQVIDVLQGQISVIQSNYSSQVAQIQADTQLTVQVANQTAISLGASRVIEAQRVAYDQFKKQLGFAAADVLEYHYYRKLRTDNSTGPLQVFVSGSSGISIASN